MVVDKWKGNLEKYLEDELGPIPDFEYGKSLLSKFIPSKWIPWPWDVSYKHKKPLLRVNKKGFGSLYSKEYGFGYLIFALIHDFIHIYQAPHLVKKLGILKWTIRSRTHINYMEGLAQLYSFKICDKIYKEVEPEDFCLLSRNNKDIEEFATKILESKRYKEGLANTLAYYLSKDTKRLREINEIKEKEFSFFNYPFEINKNIIDIVDTNILSWDKDCDKKRLTKRRLQKDPYIWGAFQISILISKGFYTMKDLIENPLSNKELEKLVES